MLNDAKLLPVDNLMQENVNM